MRRKLLTAFKRRNYNTAAVFALGGVHVNADF